MSIIQFFKEQTIHPSDTFQDILHKFGSSNGNEVFLNYAIFKLIGSQATYSTIVAYMFKLLQDTSNIHSKIVVHVYLKTLTVSDVDKHKPFIMDVIHKLTTELPDILEVSYLYKAPFVFSQIFSLISMAIDKETREKIQVVK